MHIWSWTVWIHTSADATSGSSSKAGPEVTLQPFGVVTRLGQAAVLVQLPGAHFAAAAAVQDDAHAGGALGHLQRTVTHGGAGGGGGGGVGGGEDLYSQQQNPLLETETFPKSCHTEYSQKTNKLRRLSEQEPCVIPSP